MWNKTGDALWFMRVDYEAKTAKLCRTDLLNEKCFPQELKGIWEVLDSDKNNILLKYWKSSSAQSLYLYETGKNQITPIDEKGNCRRGYVFGTRVYWMSEGNEKCKTENCVLTMNLKNGKITPLELPGDLGTFNDVKFSPAGSRFLIQQTIAGSDSLRIFRVNKNRPQEEVPAFMKESAVVWHTRWLSENEIVYTTENVGKPASIHSFNIETKKATPWTKERLPPQLTDKVKPAEIIKWQSFDGKEISGYAVRPGEMPKKSPVLIYVHGGPQVLDKPVFGSQDIRLAANLGLTIIHTNIRGSSGFGKNFMDADNVEKRGDAVKDIRALLDWIEKQPDLDANKIFLRGGSYGGFIVLATGLQEPTRVKAVIAEYPLVSIRGLLSQSWIDDFAKNEYGDPKDEKLMQKLDALSPLNNTEKWSKKIPLFLTRGKLDERNPEKDVIDLKNQLQKKDAEVWFIYSTTSGHGFGGKYVNAAMYQFLKKQISEENKR